ncbi:MAG: DUF1569 domain-containing protein [Tepidisphaeraceae bacterium]
MSISISRRKLFWLLIALIADLLLTPLLDTGPRGELLLSFVTSVVLIAGAYAVSARPLQLIIACVLGLPVVIARWICVSLRQPLPSSVLALSTLFLGFMTVNLIAYTMSTRARGREAIYGAISGYLLIGMTWAVAYGVLERVVPYSLHFDSAVDNQLTRSSMTYFSFMTLTTAAYGDIIPTNPYARIMAMLESATGVLYVAILISRLITSYRPFEHLRRRDITYRDFDEVTADAEMLANAGYERAGHWGLAEVCDHLSRYMRQSLEGFEDSRNWVMRRIVGPTLGRRILRTRRMPGGVITPAALRPSTGRDEREAVTELKEWIGRVSTATDFRGVAEFGPLSPEQWRQVHLIHAAHHMSFLVPRNPGNSDS